MKRTGRWSTSFDPRGRLDEKEESSARRRCCFDGERRRRREEQSDAKRILRWQREKSAPCPRDAARRSSIGWKAKRRDGIPPHVKASRRELVRPTSLPICAKPFVHVRCAEGEVSSLTQRIDRRSEPIGMELLADVRRWTKKDSQSIAILHRTRFCSSSRIFKKANQLPSS